MNSPYTRTSYCSSTSETNNNIECVRRLHKMLYQHKCPMIYTYEMTLSTLISEYYLRALTVPYAIPSMRIRNKLYFWIRTIWLSINVLCCAVRTSYRHNITQHRRIESFRTVSTSVYVAITMQRTIIHTVRAIY